MTVPGSDGRPRTLAEGDRVRRGDVVARLRKAEYRDKVEQATGQVAAARAAARKARLDWERATRLIATRSITRPEYDGARAQHDTTEAQLSAAAAALQEARVALRDTELASPLDGDVVKKAVEPGALVGAGSLAFVVADVSTVKVVVGVPDVALRSLALGQPVSVSSDALPGQSFQARISRIATAADPDTRNFDIEIAIPNPQRAWRAGMIAIMEASEQAPGPGLPMLPFSAIVEAPGQGRGFGVMVVEGDGTAATARVHKVELGEVVGNRVAVARGLSPGDRVVTTGASLLADGERVEIAP
jgi:multidrug efflux system membrane fusion protein